MNNLIPKLIGLGIGAVFALFIIFGSFYTIDQGDRGVILNNGAVAGEAGPGRHWKAPIVQSVEELSIRSQKMEWSGNSYISAYTRDKQVATVHLAVIWHATDVTKTYTTYRNVETLGTQVIVPKTMEVFKNEFGKVDSTAAITERGKLNGDVQTALVASVVGYPLMIDSVQITDISFSDAYDKAVAANMEAQVAVLKARADMQRQNIEADTRLYAAKADADAVAYTGKQEAAAIRDKGEALRANPEVVALTTAQKWDGKLPETMVPGSAVPFIDVRK